MSTCAFNWVFGLFSLLIFLFKFKHSLRDVWQYKLSDDAWVKIAELNIGRFSHSMTALDGSVYVFGGIDNRQKRILTVERFDMFQNKWLCDIPDIPVSVIDAKPVAIRKHERPTGWNHTSSPHPTLPFFAHT